ncbi:MAG: DUF3098 domain-containing protein [Maribacter sp.]|nr:DUF3098 domain-containing protein [Maribacter sp.]
MGKKETNKMGQGPQQEFIFQEKNYLFRFIGIACIVLGFILMSGGGSDDPSIFNEDIFNFRRIRLAPTLVLIGLGIEVYAILLNPHKNK